MHGASTAELSHIPIGKAASQALSAATRLASSVAITAANKSNYWSEAQQRHAAVPTMIDDGITALTFHLHPYCGSKKEKKIT
jgi:hypothetical protein